MEEKTDNKLSGGKVAIIGAAITAIAGIITTVVSISGPIIDKQIAIQTTQTREAFLVEATRIAGVSALVTETPAPFTPTAAATEPVQAQAEQTLPPATPTLTPAPVVADTQPPATATQPQPTSTPAETYLKVGEDWDVGNGLTVRLTDIEFPSANEVHLQFAFINTSEKVMKVTVDHNRDVTLTDDKGNIYQWASEFTWEVKSQPKTTRKDEVKKRGDVSLASYFIVKLELQGIGSAQWKE